MSHHSGDNGEPHLIVIGGGITGLTAAYYASRPAEASFRSPRVTLIEAGNRLGGKVETLRRDGFVIERGPDSFLARKKPIIDLSLELGLDRELVTLSKENKGTYILRGGKLHTIPPGLVLGVPTEWKPFVTSRLISFRGKLRAAMDFVLPAAKGDEDESLGGFLRRRLGDEVVDFVAEPLLSGIYAGDADRLSLLATFPQFRAAERKYRSLMLGLGRGAGATRQGAQNEDHLPPHARGSAFLSYRQGLATLVEHLEAALTESGTTIITSTSVQSVRNRKEGGIAVTFETGETMQADAVIVTVPLPKLEPLLPDVPEAALFRGMTYASVANVVLAYRKERVNVPLNGTGFVIPRTEGRFITACTWTSSKWPHTAPHDRLVIRCYVGNADDERWREMDDETIAAGVRKEVADLVGIGAEPEFVDINRLAKSMPQYEVGHLSRVQTFRSALQEKAPGIYAAGAGFEGIGLPDCIDQGKRAAEQAMLFLSRPAEA